MSTGWVYVLSNPSIPSRVKVGWTKGRPEDRAKELQSTGVPTPFKVETAFLFANRADVVEGRAHELLSEKRVSSAREFFECAPQFAAQKVLEAGKAIGEEVKDTDPVLITAEQSRRMRVQQEIEEDQARRRKQAEEEQQKRAAEEQALRQSLQELEEIREEVRQTKATRDRLYQEFQAEMSKLDGRAEIIGSVAGISGILVIMSLFDGSPGFAFWCAAVAIALGCVAQSAARKEKKLKRLTLNVRCTGCMEMFQSPLQFGLHDVRCPNPKCGIICYARGPDNLRSVLNSI